MMDKSRKNHKKSLAVLEKTVMQDIQICISEDMLSTIYYISDDKHYTLTFFQKLSKNGRFYRLGRMLFLMLSIFVPKTERIWKMPCNVLAPKKSVAIFF